MQPLFKEYGVELFALSKDTVAQAAFHKKQDNLSFTLLSDPNLNVIQAYGLVHQNGFQFATFTLVGLPLGVPIGFKRMAIPTTLLLDEKGVVRWIDQAEDYRLRGNEERIRSALKTIWG